jgi:hypothetical protein
VDKVWSRIKRLGLFAVTGGALGFAVSQLYIHFGST